MLQHVSLTDGFGTLVDTRDERGIVTDVRVACRACGRDVHTIAFLEGRAICASQRLLDWTPVGTVVDPRLGLVRAIPLHPRLHEIFGPIGFEVVATGGTVLPETLAPGVREQAESVAFATVTFRGLDGERKKQTVYWNQDDRVWEAPHPTDPRGNRVRIDAHRVRPA